MIMASSYISCQFLAIICFISLLIMSTDLTIPTVNAHFAQQSAGDYPVFSCSKPVNLTDFSPYNETINSLQQTLNIASINATFNKTSTGIFNGFYQCRLDVNQSACQTCVSDAIMFSNTSPNCSTYLKRLIWKEECVFAMDNTTELSIHQHGVDFKFSYSTPLPEPKTSSRGAITNLLNQLSSMATGNVSSQMFAAGYTKLGNSSNSTIIYGYVQCGGVEEGLMECKLCLKNITAVNPVCCNDSASTAVMTASCRLQYKPNKFFPTTFPLTEIAYTAPPPPPPSSGKRTRIGSVASVFTAVAAAMMIFNMM